MTIVNTCPWLVIGIGAIGLTHAAVAPRQAPPVAEFLVHSIGMTPPEVRAIERGEPVVRILPTNESRDVAVFGIVVVKRSRAALSRALTDFPTALRAPGRTLGILNRPPTPSDFSGIVVTSRESRMLRTCRPGDCDLKLAANDMAAVRTLLRETGDSVQATAFERRRLADVASAYLEIGNRGMPTYDDFQNRSVRGNVAFSALLSAAPDLYGYAPGLRNYLASYPHAHLDASHDVLYWARDEISGLQPITTLNHRVVYTPSDIAGVTVEATKQVLANHFLEAGLEVLIVVDRANVPSSAYWMLLRRYRFDQMPKKFMFSLRGRVTAKLREQAAADLLRARAGGRHD